MAVINDSVRVRATPQQAYAALTRPEGYRGWWSKNCAIGAGVGRESMLHFDKSGTQVSMRYTIDRLEQDQRVLWTCVAHDMPSWLGTTLEWKVVPSGGEVQIELAHANWKDAPPEPVVQGWRHFLSSLKKYLETGTGEPW